MAEIVGEMEKGWNEKILFSVTEFRGKNYADIRIYYEDDEGEWKPTRKGVTVSLDAFPEFFKKVEELGKYLREHGYISGEDSE
ncbi:MAG: hypothetical protein Kow00109_25690 [Acidobacteriota bacterium]